MARGARVVDTEGFEPGVLLLAKMALADGVVDDSERTHLTGSVGAARVDALLEEAGQTDLRTLILRIHRYEDGVFLALRAHYLAGADGALDPDELAIFNQIADHVALSEEDRALVVATSTAMVDGTLEELPEALQAYLWRSSFA